MAEGKIHAAICGVMKDVGAVAKTDENTFDRYKFRGIDAVMNALHPAMVKNHVYVTPTVIDSLREDRTSRKGDPVVYTVLTVKYTFYTDDGSSVEATVVGEALDRSDKSTNKAMSAAYKYACFQTFCIPTEEFYDADKESIEAGQKNATQGKPDGNPLKPENGTPAAEKIEGEEVGADGYPTRAKMIAVVMSKYPAGAEDTEKMLKYYGFETLGDLKKLKDAQLKVLFNKAMKK